MEGSHHWPSHHPTFQAPPRSLGVQWYHSLVLSTAWNPRLQEVCSLLASAAQPRPPEHPDSTHSIQPRRSDCLMPHVFRPPHLCTGSGSLDLGCPPAPPHPAECHGLLQATASRMQTPVTPLPPNFCLFPSERNRPLPAAQNYTLPVNFNFLTSSLLRLETLP